MGVAVAKDAATRAAPVIVNSAQRGMDYLLGLVEKCDKELSWIIDTVPPQTDGEYRAWQETKIKHVAEIRKLVNAMSDIHYKLFHANTVGRALVIMFEEIGHESKECQKRIKARLERASINFHLDD
jgi:hypothetical protein